MPITLSPATTADAPTLALIGSLAYANDALFNIFRPQETDSSPTQQKSSYLAWRTSRSRNRMTGEGKHWFKATDSQTGNIVGFTGIWSPEVYATDEKSDEVPPAFVNEELLREGERAKALGKERFLGGRRDVWSMVVHPYHQGHGTGTLLLNEACLIADRAGQDVYLEATPAGRKLYLNAGFEVLGTAEVLEGTYVLTFMLRRARSP
ncbi:hypothetical protein Q7P37_009186 [Cladosporium fusiforme]